MGKHHDEKLLLAVSDELKENILELLPHGVVVRALSLQNDALTDALQDSKITVAILSPESLKDSDLEIVRARLNANHLHVILTAPKIESGWRFMAQHLGYCDVLPQGVDKIDIKSLLWPLAHLWAQTDEIQGWNGSLESGVLVGVSRPMMELKAFISRIAPLDSPVLVTGETGTGKELVARALHAQRLCNDRPFVAINCAAITESIAESELFGHVEKAFTGAQRRAGAFGEADGGTLLLDDVQKLPSNIQPKLLRSIESKCIRTVGGTGERRVDVRVIATTNKDLGQECELGNFQWDLYHRITRQEISIQPLRDRKEDIAPITEFFLVRISRKLGRRVVISPEALTDMKRHHWPGNVRQLYNILEKAAALSERNIDAKVIRGLLSAAPTSTEGLDDEARLLSRLSPKTVGKIIKFDQALMRPYTERAFKQRGWNITQVARDFDFSRPTMYKKQKRLGLKRPKNGSEQD